MNVIMKDHAPEPTHHWGLNRYELATNSAKRKIVQITVRLC